MINEKRLAPRTQGIFTRSLLDADGDFKARAPHLKKIFSAVRDDVSMSLSQWTYLYSVAKYFKPSVIIELGRLYGNSTTAFNQAAREMGGCGVFSFCLSNNWRLETAPAIMNITGPDWFKTLDARETRIEDVDFAPLVRDEKRVLVFWDAHGNTVADVALGRILPLIYAKDHLVINHDVSDARYAGSPNDYEGKSFWRGEAPALASKTARLKLGWMDTVVEQFIPLVDFLGRNGISLHSVDDDLQKGIYGDQATQKALFEKYPPEFVKELAHMAYFSLNEMEGAPYFPAFPRKGSDEAAKNEIISRLGSIFVYDLGRYNVNDRPTPLTWLRIMEKLALNKYNLER